MIGHGEIVLRWRYGRCEGIVDGKRCKMAVRELGARCTPCWRGLTARERAHYTWCADVEDKIQIDYDVLDEADKILRLAAES